MKLTIKAKNIQMTPDIQAYFEKRLASLGRIIDFDDNGVSIQAELEKSTHHKTGEVYRAEIKMNRGGWQAFVTAEGSSILEAIDKVKDELGREVKTGKEKHRSLEKEGATKVKKFLKEGEAEIENEDAA